MVCKSPLRFSCPQLDIGSGFLYRRRGTIVRENDSVGISCRSSVCTASILQCEISHWKMGKNCRATEKVLCDGSESEEKCFKWRLPIPPLRFAESSSPDYSFDARWNPVFCDQTHCVIAIHVNGQEVTHFAELTEDVRISLHVYLKRKSVN
jgi:hypothetical protein